MKELRSLSIKGEKIINVWKIRKNVENNKLESSPGLWKFPEGGFSGCSAQSAAKILSPPLEKSPPPPLDFELYQTQVIYGLRERI